VRDEAAATVVTVHRLDDIDAAVAVTADVEKTAVSGQANRVQPPVTIDEGDPCDLVPCDPVKEAVAATGGDSPLRG